ncbi:hypothetical protein [Nocardioides astragali]|uniref:Uncharacterized protein n=1 Tax=Nocardioides astragali TaxID=1776736 RepID=A0ABW2NAX2_9ACTN|nr:hypothetical protein [Nocardioides astragali]
MTTEQAWLAATGTLAIGVALVAVALAVRASRRAARAEASVDTLVERLEVLESAVPPAATTPTATSTATGPAEPAPGAFVITRLDESERPDVPVARDIDGRLFADIVARETVVKAASWTHGLRRALSADNRHRIRLEVRREIRRAGRDRRAETKQALREYRARERAGHDGGVREDVA